MKKLDECTCICHRSPGVKHCVPCCNICPRCGKNIIRGRYQQHLKECLDTKEENESSNE